MKRYAIFMESLNATFSEEKGLSIIAKVLSKDKKYINALKIIVACLRKRSKAIVDILGVFF